MISNLLKVVNILLISKILKKMLILKIYHKKICI